MMRELATKLCSFPFDFVWAIKNGFLRVATGLTEAEREQIRRDTYTCPYNHELDSEDHCVDECCACSWLEGQNQTIAPAKYVVGQDVYMFLDSYPHWFCNQSGKVVKVMPTGVEVQTAGELLRFDTNNIPVFIVGQTTLVVGQDVDVAYCQRKDRRGKVVKVTPTSVEVEVADLLRFDNHGKETDASRRERLGFGPSPGDKFYNFLWFSAPEFQPWVLDDIPFAERTALLEQKYREWKAVSEQKDRDFRALFERAAQAAQGGGSTKIAGLLDFLNVEESLLANRMWKESKHDYANRIAKQIIEPSIARINGALGQENSPKYLSYVVEYIMEYAEKKCN